MSIEERFSRFNPKVSSFELSFGGFGAMTVQEFLASMYGVSPIGEFIIWRKYVDDKTRGLGYVQLMKEAIYRVDDKEKREKIRTRIPELFDIALEDYTGLFKCPQCNGRSQLVLPTGQVHKCRSQRCINGYVQRRDHERAKVLKVKPIDYSRNYKPAYLVIDKYLTETLPEAESAALSRIIRQAKWHD